MVFLEVVEGDEVYVSLYRSLDKEITKIEQYPSSVTTLKTANIVLTLIQEGLVHKKEVYQRRIYGSNVTILTFLKALLFKVPDWVKAVGLCLTLLMLYKFVTAILSIISLACICIFFISRSQRLYVIFKHLFESYDANHQEERSLNVSIRESIKESIYEASQNISDAYIKKKGCDSILARANIEVIRSGKLFQYKTEDIEIIARN